MQSIERDQQMMNRLISDSHQRRTQSKEQSSGYHSNTQEAPKAKVKKAKAKKEATPLSKALTMQIE